MTRRDRLETTYNQSQLIVNSDFRSISIQAVVFPTFTNREEQFNLDSTEDANHVSLCDRAGPPVAAPGLERRDLRRDGASRRAKTEAQSPTVNQWWCRVGHFIGLQ